MDHRIDSRVESGNDPTWHRFDLQSAIPDHSTAGDAIFELFRPAAAQAIGDSELVDARTQIGSGRAMLPSLQRKE